jgi:competence protein ComEC
LKRLDYAIVTHFHADHFGGMATIASQIPIGQLWDNGIPDLDPDHKPDSAIWLRTSKPYRDIKADKHVVNAGDVIPLKQAPGGMKLSFRCVAAKQTFVEVPASAAKNPLTAELVKHDADSTDNANSSVWVVDFGPFRFFDGGDLTWNREGELVTPVNRVGHVDVYQVDHHGLALSNNPVLIHSLTPTIAVMNNGPKKGTAKSTIEGLKSSPGIQAIYQNHKNVRPGEAANNTSDDYIANMDEDSNACAGNYIKMIVAADGKTYTIEIPAKGLKKTYQTRLDKE